MTNEMSSLALTLHPLQRLLDNPEYTEIVINRPGEVLTENREGWHIHSLPELTYDWCLDVANMVANRGSDRIGEDKPILSGQLPGGERVQIVIPPTVPSGTISITIRRPATTVLSIEHILSSGAFESTRAVQSMRLTPEERQTIEPELSPLDRDLLTHYRARNWHAFLQLAVTRRKNIIVSGRTGSGKTTLCNALAALIPHDERIITVEDVREMRLPHRNWVAMSYQKDGRSALHITPKQVFESNLRQRPDRVLPAELRGDETFYFIQNVINSGHPGTITTVHANSSRLAFMRLSYLIKASPEGNSLHRDDIMQTLHALIDIVIHMDPTEGGTRVASEVYFDPVYAAYQAG
jgi:type IV secretion system protein VirB11